MKQIQLAHLYKNGKAVSNLVDIELNNNINKIGN